MKISNVHERTIEASPGQLEAIVADLDGIWPTQIAPYPDGELLRTGTMRWQEFDRPGAVRAFRVVSPPELRAEHWFEVEPVKDGTVLRHTIDGEAFGQYQAIWRDRIEPGHDLVLEALLETCSRSLNERIAQERHTQSVRAAKQPSVTAESLGCYPAARYRQDSRWHLSMGSASGRGQSQEPRTGSRNVRFTAWSRRLQRSVSALKCVRQSASER